jgi:hypothetical protein
MTAHFIGGDTSRLKVVATGEEIQMLEAWVKRLRSEFEVATVPSVSSGPGYLSAEITLSHRRKA